MSSTIYWLQLEAQNFSSSVFDTQDLSTIRGGSLLLRDLVADANKWLVARYGGRVKDATLGGSIGVWRVETTADDAAELTREMRENLMAGIYRNVGFGIGLIADAGGGYRAQRARLTAVLQRQRLAQTRTPYPETSGSGVGVCPVDLIRPQGSQRQKIGPGKYIQPSGSVFDRRRFGMKKKQALIGEEIGARATSLSAEACELLKTGDRPFAMQMNSISEGAEPPTGLKASLHDKVCVISLDGNGFGKIQDAAFAIDDSIDAQRKFDEDLARLRALLIARTYGRLVALGGAGKPSAIEAAVREDLEGSAPDQVVRFEMLLWGGDELMFIVPARIGWQLICEVAETIVPARLCDQAVSFAIGAVFCHHDAPISRIKVLADDLCRRLKGLAIENGRGRNGKSETLILPQVLESFDHIGGQLELFLKGRWPKNTEVARVPAATGAAFDALDLEDMKVLRLAAQDLATGKGGKLSRGRLRKAAHALHWGEAPGAQYRGDHWIQFVADSAGLLRGANCEAAVERLGRDRFFVLLEHFWDYLVPVRSEIGDSSSKRNAA